MEYLTQFKNFLKTNNGSDTHLPAQSWRTLLQLSFQACTARLRAHALLNIEETYTHLLFMEIV